MECAFCSIEFNGKPYRRDGRIYCSRDCADAHTEEIYGADDMENETELEESFDEEYEEEF